LKIFLSLVEFFENLTVIGLFMFALTGRRDPVSKMSGRLGGDFGPGTGQQGPGETHIDCAFFLVKVAGKKLCVPYDSR
jgi:uncharacterized membrane protein